MKDLKIFTENIEQEAIDQINTLLEQPVFADCKVRIMPDVHTGAGCVIGFTANLGDKVIPNIVGVDIGCGMLTVNLGKIDIDYEKLDRVIREVVPAGRNVHGDDAPEKFLNRAKRLIAEIRCKRYLRNVGWLEHSLGTLGGGNHFIEIDEAASGNKYLIIHTGSRNLGKQVADYYQSLAIEKIYDDKEERTQLIAKLKQEGRAAEIQAELAKLKKAGVVRKLPKSLCYLEGVDRRDYLHDMEVCQRFAYLNRNTIASRILDAMGWTVKLDMFDNSDWFHTIHNYIEVESNMVRKGAISAKKDELVLIPISMRDGCIIGIGKGNEDWNCSAPHGMAYHEVCGCGNLIDPWGGYGDLDAKLIRCVRNPDDRFREDALRILRALRFASTYGFKIEERTAAAIHRNKELLKNVSAERIREELCKLLCGKGVLDILLEYKDVMTVIIPELKPCIGFNQNNPYHIYDVYDHSAHAVANFKGNDSSIKMALLLHDIGKPECYIEDDEGNGHFYGHGVDSMRIAKDVMERLKFDNKTKKEVADLVLYHDADIQPHFRAVRRWLNKIGPGMLEKLLCIRVADIIAQSEIDQTSRIDKCYLILDIAYEALCKQQCFKLEHLAVNGHDIMNLGVEAGPRVGKVLNYLLDEVLDGTIKNEREALIAEAKKYLEGD